jgi:hypothetical protein
VSSLREPRRWADAGDAELPDGFIDALSEYGEWGPDELSRARTKRALVSKVAAPPTAADEVRAPAAPPTAGRFALLVRLATGLLLLGLHETNHSRLQLRMKSPQVTRAAAAGGVQRARSFASDPPAAAPVEPTVAVPHAIATAEPPVTAPPAKPTRRIPQALPAETSMPSHADPALELDLLSRARRVVNSAPQRALELAEQHAHTYPNGLFSQEREVLIIDALHRLGRRAEAVARVQRFRRNYPSSAYLTRVEALLAAP